MTDEEIDDLVLKIYRARLDWECDGNAERQYEKDKDDGTKQRNRSKSYRPIVVETLVQAGVYVRPVRPPPVRKTPPEPTT